MLADDTKTQKKIDDISALELIRLAKARVINAIEAGKPGMAKELECLLALEKTLAEKNNQPPSEKSEIQNPKSETEDEVGIPEHLRIKRKYTMTEAALEVRRKGGRASRKNHLMT